MFRFAGYVCLAFITGAVGLSWALRGFPTESPKLFTEVPPKLNVTFGDGHSEERERERWLATQTLQSDRDPKRDQVRLDLLQSATGYFILPCDETMKANLIAALAAYTEAWQDKLNCSKPINWTSCSDKKRDEANAAFSTPLDIKVRAAVAEAIEQGGIVRADFPASLRSYMSHFAGTGLWSESPVCESIAESTGRPQ